jgi:hypothetical protein
MVNAVRGNLGHGARKVGLATCMTGSDRIASVIHRPNAICAYQQD